MWEGASEEFPKRLSRDSTLPLSTVYLLLIMTSEDKLYQLAITQHIVHQERPIADPDVLSRVIDIGAFLTQKTTCFLIWLECPHRPPAAVSRRGSWIIFTQDGLPDDASDAVCADQNIAVMTGPVGTMQLVNGRTAQTWNTDQETVLDGKHTSTT